MMGEEMRERPALNIHWKNTKVVVVELDAT